MTTSLTSQISYDFSLSIPFDMVIRPAVSYYHEGLSMRPRIDLRTRDRGYPIECLRSPEEHLWLLERKKLIGKGLIITQTHRNGFQNLRTPLYSRQHGICQSADEKVQGSRRPYYGIAHMDNGTFKAIAMDFCKDVPQNIEFWCGGIPVLWENEVLNVKEIIPEVADFCHLWQLDVSKYRGEKQEDIKRYDRLTQIYNDYLHAHANEAAEAICKESNGLKRENDYLHNAVGVGQECLLILCAHGSLEEIGRKAKRNGATHCVVGDNGGSCQIGLKRPYDALKPLIQSYYFRPPTICLRAYQIKTNNPNEIPIKGIGGR